MIKEMVSIAKGQGQGWITYPAWNPKSGQALPNVSLVKRVGQEEMRVGAGTYMSEGKSFP